VATLAPREKGKPTVAFRDREPQRPGVELDGPVDVPDFQVDVPHQVRSVIVVHTHPTGPGGNTVSRYRVADPRRQRLSGHGLGLAAAAIEEAWRAADKVVSGEPPDKWAAMSKTKATETARDVPQDAMQLHGGRSVLDERRIARVYRDVRIPVFYEGANEIHRNLIYRQSG